MMQKTIAVPPSADELKAIDAAVTTLEQQLVELFKQCREHRQQPDTGTPGQTEPTAPDVPVASLDALNATIDALNTHFDKIVRLSDEGRRQLPTLDEKSEAFCRETLNLLDRNRDQLPPDFDLDSALDKMRTRDALRPLTARLRRLSAIVGR